ncbi:ABC transporter ATP-binding protein [Herbiconiux sp. KACC 21604]|uniref:ABC transporter ATP-binding protein n=1 Tax=unclassified Herbiconiux TaxID=2618217 RepID=UPI0014917597|nr:ABC transporter ATP-binding protein [Herbiconiux sp. SALV-R1]QJU55414.1 ABC transporter ATP-binding protein [Herbiconiux sp. SALV-R1]WPO86591.1 ABC transporter ATP-binding protein [Herbiconiux sp. KACC 21604]
MGDAMVEFDELSMTFPDGTTALRDVDIRIEEGEFVALLGPSGCGKSTLLRLASGLETATGGATRVATRQIGYVFQDATLLPWRTVRQNVALFAELDHLSAAETAALVDDALERVGLTGFAKHRPHQLSGGMKMRVSLARSLVNRPELFLFDEPFGALDEFTRERLNDDVRSLFVRERFTGMFVTHSIPEAVYMSTRVVVMGARPGRVIGEFAVPFGDARDEHTRYSPEFAALATDISDCLKGAMA